MNYNVRISDNFLRGDHVDGEVLQHTDLNEIEDVTKIAINANYEDIQKLQNGDTLAGNSEQLSGATLSKFATETLQNSDTKVPTSAQVKQYVDGELSHIYLSGYYTKREIDDKILSSTDEDDSTNKTYSTKYINENKVNYTDIAADDSVGVVKTSEDYCTYTEDDGTLKAYTLDDYGDYENWDNDAFISKGTLETVLSWKPIMTIAGGVEPFNALDLNTELDSGTYLITGWVRYGNKLKEFIMPSLVSKGDWDENDVMAITFYSENIVGKVKREGTYGNYTYTWLGDFEFINKDDLNDYYTKTDTDTLLDGKADVSDLTDYVKNTDYATASKAGVIKSGYYGLQVDGTNGKAYCDTYTYANYGNVENQRFVSKGTLENVITGKGLVSNTDYASSSTGGTIMTSNSYATSMVNGYLRSQPKTYAEYTGASGNMFISKGTLENVLTATIGDISSVIDAINGESI